MLKMFTTQLSGLFNRIQEKNEFALEDTARLLAQAAVGEGHIYFATFNELNVLTIEAIESSEPFPNIKKFENVDELTESDRVLIATRFSNDVAALQLAKQLSEKHIPFASICGFVTSEEEGLHSLAYSSINTTLLKGLLPTDDGSRIGFPASIAALYIYYGIKFTLEEILSEYYEEE